MRNLRIAQESARALVAHKLRTFFMMTGTIVGIAALTVIMAVGKGTEKKVMKRVNAFGTHVIAVTAGGGKGFSPPQEDVTTLKPDDAEAVRAQVSGIRLLNVFAMKRALPIKAGTNQTQAVVTGTDQNWHAAWDWDVSDGEPITEEDQATMARVCLLGTTTAWELFGNQNPIGEYVQVGNVRFRVKGVLQTRGVSPHGGDFDSRVMIPLSTGLRRLFNQDYVTSIRIKVADSSRLDQLGEEIRQVLRQRHAITPPKEDDFAVFTAAEVAKEARGISGILTYLLIALAGLSLLVGGIVLMNILLISVGERKKEIGLRRALGATQGDIFRQFLVESLAVTIIGMVAGSLLGWAISFAMARFTQSPVVVTWEPFALALAFALVVGVFFGVQPARRAAKLRPVEALR